MVADEIVFMICKIDKAICELMQKLHKCDQIANFVLIKYIDPMLKMKKLICAPREDSDKLGHSLSMFRIFALNSNGSCVILIRHTNNDVSY